MYIYSLTVLRNMEQMKVKKKQIIKHTIGHYSAKHFITEIRVMDWCIYTCMNISTEHLI